MITGNAVKSVTMDHLDLTSITTSYTVIYEDGFDNACSMIRIHNATNSPLWISFNGTTDNDYLAIGASLQLPVQDNHLPSGLVAKFKKKSKVYVKFTVAPKPPLGTVYLIGYYN